MATKPQKREDDLPGDSDREDDDERDERSGRAGGVTVNIDEVDRQARSDDGGKKKRDEDEARSALLEADEQREKEERAARRKAEREEEKRRREERDAAKDRKVEALTETVQQLQTRLQQRDGEDLQETMVRVEDEMREMQRHYDTARSLKEKAIRETKDNPDAAKAAVDADDAMVSARERYNELGNMRGRIVTEIRRSAAQPKMSPVGVEGAKSFITDHNWYDKDGKDRDSAKVLQIDAAMGKEGWNPNTAGYWEELRIRVKDALPHRFEDAGRDRDDDERDRERRDPPRRSPTGGSSRDSGGKGRQFYLSPERVQAIKDAGMWDDETKRARMIQRYRAEDEKRR